MLLDTLIHSHSIVDEVCFFIVITYLFNVMPLQRRAVVEPARHGAGQPARVHAARGARAAQEARAAAQATAQEPQSTYTVYL